MIDYQIDMTTKELTIDFDKPDCKHLEGITYDNIISDICETLDALVNEFILTHDRKPLIVTNLWVINILSFNDHIDGIEQLGKYYKGIQIVSFQQNNNSATTKADMDLAISSGIDMMNTMKP